MKTDKRFIEESFPVKEVSAESAREKNIRHGHISTLHIWWARRPLASSRATSYAALIPAPKTTEEWNAKRNFIIDLCKWENSLNEKILEKARQDILDANGGVPPRVLDPFGGGGAIPLEALRLGCEVYSNDLNPVAVLIQKCTLEYPQKYGRPVKRKIKKEIFGQMVEEEEEVNPLLEDVKKWGQWVLEEAKKEIGQFYPNEPNGSIPVGYIWARTIPCQNPACGAEIPLMRQFWLAKKKNKNVALFPYVENNAVYFKIVGDGYERLPNKFNPNNGTISKAIVTCPICHSSIGSQKVKMLFQNKKDNQKLISVVSHKPGENGKFYRISTKADVEIFNQTKSYLELKRQILTEELGLESLPDEIIHTPDGKEYKPGKLLYNFTPVLLYNMTKWSDLFNLRAPA